IRVADDGIGIRPEMLPRLFEMFQQADRVPGQPTEGLGVGLSLVRKLVELHGGTVSASSAGPGRGSEFVVRLPLGAERSVGGGEGETRRGGEKTAIGDRAVSPPLPLPPSPPLQILVVDDHTDGAESLAML